MEIYDFKTQLIKYYMGKGKSDFILRLRGLENDPEIECYYKGIQVFQFAPAGKFELNEAVFLPNDKNDKRNKERAKIGIDEIEVPKKPQDRVSSIQKLGFSFRLDPTLVLPFSSKIDYEKADVSVRQLLEKNQIQITKMLEEMGIFIQPWKKKYSGKDKNKQIGYETEIIRTDAFDYIEIYKMILFKYSWNHRLEKLKSTRGRSFTGYSSMKVKVKFELQKEEILLKKLDQFNAIMKQAIEVYTIKKENEDPFDFTNTREDSEKAYQQKLMNLMICEDTKKSLTQANGPFDNADIPFEMEYYIYPSNIYYLPVSKRKIRNDNNRKGRLDNIVFNPESGELKLIEIKIGTKVIGGTNGIHKHLLDLTNCILKNPNLGKEIFDHILMRNHILESLGDEELAFRVPSGIEKISYTIICGYTDEENKKQVEARLNEIKDQTILSKEVFASGENRDLSSLQYLEFIEDLKKRTPENPANEYPLELLDQKILDYCDILRKGDLERGIPPIDVRIFIADADFLNFEEKITNI